MVSMKFETLILILRLGQQKQIDGQGQVQGQSDEGVEEQEVVTQVVTRNEGDSQVTEAPEHFEDGEENDDYEQ